MSSANLWKMDGLHRRLILGLTLAALVTGAFLRLYRLDHQSMFRDEGYTYGQAHAPWSVFWPELWADRHPPLYILAIRFWTMLAGPSLWSVRFFSAACAIGVCLLCVLLARELRGDRAACFAALLTAGSVHLISAAQEGRAYTLAPLLGLWFLLLILRHARRPDSVTAWGIAVSGATLLYADYLAIPLLATCAYLVPTARRPLTWAGTLWLPGLAQFVMANLAWHGPPLPFGQGARLFWNIPLGMATGADVIHAPRAVLGVIALLAWAALLARASAETRRLAGMLVAAVCLLALSTWKYGIDASAPSRSAMLTPFLLLTAALTASEQPLRRAAPLALILCGIGAMDLARGFYSTDRRGGWKQVATQFRAMPPRLPVYTPDFNYEMLRYYYPEARVVDALHPPQPPYVFVSDRGSDVERLAGPRARRVMNVWVGEVPRSAR